MKKKYYISGKERNMDVRGYDLLDDGKLRGMIVMECVRVLECMETRK